jgi:hypothetical protein
MRHNLACVSAAVFATAFAGVAMAGQTPAPADLTAEVRIFEPTTLYNAYPDACDGRLGRLYIAEDLELAIAVQFNRALSDTERAQVQWEVTNGAAVPSSGDFVEHANPTLITTRVTADSRGERDDVVVRVTYQGADLAPPLPLRVISDEEYSAAYGALAGFTAVGEGQRSQLPLTADLLARFLGQESSAVGVPSIRAYPLDICDPRLTHRAGADWGSATVTEVPLVQYDPDQPASSLVAEAAARELLSQHAEDIGTFFVENPQAETLDVEYTYDGGLTLNRPLDALLAVHGVQFDGTLSATIDAPTESRGLVTARAVRVAGTVADLYDFDLEDTGGGALAAGEAAKLQIASVKHGIGKVFVVAFSFDTSIDALDF